jgi:predicted acylesterase/phospholipase RssA
MSEAFRVAHTLASGALARLAVPLVLGGALLTAGCVTRPELGNPNAAYAEPGVVPLSRGGEPMQAMRQSLDEGLQTGYPLGDSDGDGRSDYIVLALSGGGGFGAFSAGILNGWSAAHTRPEFDVVTGVSTGALAGALAFAGPEWDPVLKRLYTETPKKDLLRIRGLDGIFSDSIASDQPLQKIIRSEVDERFVNRVAGEYRKGRRFYVATTDLDRDRLTVWDMGAVATQADPRRVERFRSILLASASFPVLFPPVYVPTVDGGAVMHVDGGLKAPMLFEPFMLDEARRFGGKRQPDIKVYTILNSKRTPDTGSAVEPDIPAIAAASLRSLYDTAVARTIHQAAEDSRKSGALFRLAAIPADLPLAGSSMSFNPTDMRTLYGVGETLARSGRLWDSTAR